MKKRNNTSFAVDCRRGGRGNLIFLTVMVTIIDGEIVQDNDPRAQAYRQRGRQQQQSDQPRNRQQAQNNMAPGVGGIGTGSIFDQLNNKLIAAGFPRWNLGQHVVEPIHSAALILALFFFGLRGILFVGLIWFLLKQSQATGQQ